MPSDADRLREVLPRLHAKGIAVDLLLDTSETKYPQWVLGAEWLTDAQAITYAIGAMVEHALLQGRCLNLGFVDPPSPLRDVIECMEILSLIDPPTTEIEQ